MMRIETWVCRTPTFGVVVYTACRNAAGDYMWAGIVHAETGEALEFDVVIDEVNDPANTIGQSMITV